MIIIENKYGVTIVILLNVILETNFAIKFKIANNKFKIIANSFASLKDMKGMSVVLSPFYRQYL